jgi:hypothetical protein
MRAALRDAMMEISYLNWQLWCYRHPSAAAGPVHCATALLIDPVWIGYDAGSETAA